MSLSVIAEPGLISLSKNPCEFHLRSTAWINVQPVAGVYKWTMVSKPLTIGGNLILSWNGNTVAFYVESTTTPTGYNLPDDITATTLAQYTQALAETWFPAQYLLQRDFEITYDGTGPAVIFTAKEPGTELAITYSQTIPSGQGIMTTATTPIAWDFKDDYAVIMDVEVEETYGSGEFTRVGTLHATPTLYNDGGTWKGDVKIDVQELLDGFLQDRTDKPNFFATSTLAANTHLQWRVVYAERYTAANETVVVRRVQSDDKQVLKGGLKYLDVPALGDLETNHFGVTFKPWNTWQPDGKEVTQAEPHWLYFLTPFQISGPDYYELNAVVYYTDGTTATATINTNAVQNQWETYFYRAGFIDEGLDLLNPTKTPYKYTLRLEETGGTMKSTVFTFYIVDSTRQDRFFVFENSLQGWDTLRCNGDFEAITGTSKTESAVPVEAGYLATDATVKVKSQGYADSFNIYSGFKKKNEIIYLRDFLNSENVFEIVDGALVPVVVESGRTFPMEHDRTGDYGYGLQFTYRHAFINKGYSNA